MLGKLSFRNAKRQAKDYCIYFITVIISVALMFSFNSIATSNDISELSSYMASFSKAISGISILIVLVMAWLINYCMRFMLEKRSKEFGTYQILGIEKKSISNIFTLENIMIGGIAFIIGIALGIFIYQILTSIIMNLFNQPYQIEISFNIKAVGMTAIYFFGIFALVLLNCRRKIKKTKVYDLLYASKKNENNMIKKAKGNVILFTLSITLLVGAILINNNEFANASNMVGRNIFIAIIMLILGIYLFYISISSFIVKRYLNNKSRKYKKDNMFLYRNLTSKINTMSLSLGTIASMFTIILIGGNVALLMNNMINNEIEMGYPYEIMISAADGDFSKYKEYIEKNTKVKDMYEYRLYNIKGIGLSTAFEKTPFKGAIDKEIDSVLSLTTYNKLREILGYEKVDLQDDEIIINCLKTAKEGLEKYTKENDKTKIVGKDVKIKEIRSENIAQVGFNGSYYAIIVPDSLIPLIEKEDQRLRDKNDNNSTIVTEQEDGTDKIYYLDFAYNFVATTENMTDEKFYKELSNYIIKQEREIAGEVNGEEQNYNIEISLSNVQTKGERMSQTKSFYTIMSFLAFYVALIFVMATATLLAIQQLSDSEKYKYRYELLRKLGVDELHINRTIFKQLLFYFAIPMVLPVIISIPVILGVGQIFTVAVTMEEIFKNICIMLGMFILVYGIYFIATDVQFDRNINGNG
ncbi:FtsX-like permease family protein [Romboutsia ilealis]|uniref:FtsX-like permease family protein n=1 Tax=Romboutsia ilealis TaxID=1115758 RepID=UPI002572B6F2|nr:FtsX-like permease family protein [Romboutsia ilealis]